MEDQKLIGEEEPLGKGKSNAEIPEGQFDDAVETAGAPSERS